ncbi:MAG: hypothetical protein ACI9MN_000691 [Saprospiraceae bacterium]|jgi:hypothetical protein
MAAYFVLGSCRLTAIAQLIYRRSWKSNKSKAGPQYQAFYW